MKTTAPLLRLFLGSIAALAASAHAQVIVDDFDDGDDAGWTRIAPLNAFVPDLATFNFPSGGYQISSGASPNPAFGAARAGSFRGDASYTDFSIEVDVVDWGNHPSQAFGVLGRISNAGLQTTVGYAFTLTLGGSLDMSRITNEAPTPIGTSASIGSLVAGTDYRLVFTGVGGVLTGTVYDAANPGVALQSIVANDNTYASGFGGVLIFDGSGTGNQPAGATFDNYRSAIPEPSATVLGLVALGLLVRRRRPVPIQR